MTTATYDAIIVGARVAGAATGLLLAGAGARVLIVDRAPEIGDTLSTHALMRPAVELLARWGLLDELVRSETPIVHKAHFHYARNRVCVDIKASRAAPGLCAPRRSVLDPALVRAARAAGADVWLGTSVKACIQDAAGRVTGVNLRMPDGSDLKVHADLVIGADGRISAVAEMVRAGFVARSPHRTALTYGYVPGIPNRGYRWYFDLGVTAGAIPTNGGLHCVFASCPPAAFARRFGADPRAGLVDALRSFDAEVAALVDAAPAPRMYRYPGAPGHIRTRTGPGWALIGDAACFKDPVTAHGMTDALLDAHALAEALVSGKEPQAYARARGPQAAEIFDVTQRIASFDWDPDTLQDLHATLNACMKREHATLSASPALAFSATVAPDFGLARAPAA